MSQLPFGWVCFSNHQEEKECPMCETMSQLPFGWVCFSNKAKAIWFSRHKPTSQLPFGWVCFSNCHRVSDYLARAKYRERSGVGEVGGEMAVGFVAAKRGDGAERSGCWIFRQCGRQGALWLYFEVPPWAIEFIRKHRRRLFVGGFGCRHRECRGRMQRRFCRRRGGLGSGRWRRAIGSRSGRTHRPRGDIRRRNTGHGGRSLRKWRRPAGGGDRR